MGSINLTRVLLGGLLAGFVLSVGEYVLNEIVLGAQWDALQADLNIGEATLWQAVAFIVMTLAVGIVLIWIYAAIRPRFGAGWKTAVIAGLTMWSIAWLLISLSLFAAGMFPAGMTVTSIVWGFFEVPVAAVAGAWIYREIGEG